MTNYKWLNYDILRPKKFYKNINANIVSTYNNIRENKGFIKNNHCPICLSKNSKEIFSDSLNTLLKCVNCEVGYLKYFARDINDIYNNKAYFKKSKKNYLKNENYRKSRFAKERLKLIKKIYSKKSKKQFLLDIGCGTGWFLNEAKKIGYEIFGQELSKDLADFSSKKNSCKIFTDDISKINLNFKFDIITCFDVIEHLKKPESVFSFAIKNLKKNGILVIFTPNLNSLCFNYLKSNSQLFCADHLFYFNFNSLNNLAKKKFKKVFGATCGTDIFDIIAYKEYLNPNKFKQVNMFCNKIQEHIDKENLANHLRVIYKKI